MNKTEYLNDLLSSLTNDGFDFIEFRHNQEWYGIFIECRYIDDSGEYLGKDWKEAEKTLRLFYE